ncbi:MAG: hypothetical protein ACOX5P_00640 [Bacilli bacterium]
MTDYRTRRAINRTVNLSALNLVQEGIIDFFGDSSG